jgi:hypothetical protein
MKRVFENFNGILVNEMTINNKEKVEIYGDLNFKIYI